MKGTIKKSSEKKGRVALILCEKYNGSTYIPINQITKDAKGISREYVHRVLTELYNEGIVEKEVHKVNERNTKGKYKLKESKKSCSELLNLLLRNPKTYQKSLLTPYFKQFGNDFILNMIDNIFDADAKKTIVKAAQASHFYPNYEDREAVFRSKYTETFCRNPSFIEAINKNQERIKKIIMLLNEKEETEIFLENSLPEKSIFNPKRSNNLVSKDEMYWVIITSLLVSDYVMGKIDDTSYWNNEKETIKLGFWLINKQYKENIGVFTGLLEKHWERAQKTPLTEEDIEETNKIISAIENEDKEVNKKDIP